MARRLAAVAALGLLAVLVLASPGGAARPPFADQGGDLLDEVVLTGAEEVGPGGTLGVGDPDGSGFAHIIVNPGQGSVCWFISVEDITLPAIGAHIHLAPAGVNGPIVVPLTPPGADGVSFGCTEGLPFEGVKNIQKDPEAYYVNVHTTDFPGGALRGQMSR